MKHFILFLLFSLSLFTTEAQLTSIGIESGFISSTNSNYEFTSLENRRSSFDLGVNFNFQLGTKIGLGEKLDFNTGLHYLQQGSRRESPGCFVFYEEKDIGIQDKLDYLQIPVSLTFKIGKESNLVLRTGVYGAYNVRAFTKYNRGDGTTCEIGIANDLTGSTNEFYVGSQFAIGYKLFESEKMEMNTFLKYYQGLTDIGRDRKSQSLLWTIELGIKR